MVHYKTLSELNKANGFPASENPMLTILRCNQSCSIAESEFTGDFFMIGLKKMKSGAIIYGRTKYDNDSGFMYFMKPRQVIKMKDIELEEAGFAIIFHEDFLNGHRLYSEIKKYSYFDYEVNEALHLSPREEQIIWELYGKIETEYNNNQDEYSREIILTNLDSILKYAQRFYKRQFINRAELSGKVASRFSAVLARFFANHSLHGKSLPSVNYIAGELNISAKYLSDLLKQETGKTAMELIHIFLITEAKNLLRSADQSVSEVAYKLGFENPPYFSRLFKKEVGITPIQFKMKYLN